MVITNINQKCIVTLVLYTIRVNSIFFLMIQPVITFKNLILFYSLQLPEHILIGIQKFGRILYRLQSQQNLDCRYTYLTSTSCIIGLKIVRLLKYIILSVQGKTIVGRIINGELFYMINRVIYYIYIYIKKNTRSLLSSRE